MNARAVDDIPAPPAYRPMRDAALNAIMAIEERAYVFHRTQGVFRDCLLANHPAWVLVDADVTILGYAVLSFAAYEAHVLNLCTTPEAQGRGYGRRLLRALLQLARGRGAQRVFLEVRPSNAPAIALYHDEGFNEIGRRPRYYPARDGREDALVMALELLSDDA